MNLTSSDKQDILTYINSRLEKDGNPSDIKKEIRQKWGISARYTRRLYNKLLLQPLNNLNQLSLNLDDENFLKQSYETDEKYYYNEDDDKYVVYLKSANKFVVVSGDKHRSMLKAYSNWDGNTSTINEICRNFEFPRDWFIEYKTIFGWTHDKEPVSDEELLKKDEDEIVRDILQQKRFSIFQKFEKQKWKETQEEANKWRELVAKRLNPFENFVNTFNYSCPKLNLNKNNSFSDSSDVFVLGLSDVHFGNYAEGKCLYHQSHNELKTVESDVSKLANDIYSLSKERKLQTLEILFLGDILDSLTGYTEKGTKLDTFPVGEIQFEAAFKSISDMIVLLSQAFKHINIKCVSGNHSYFGDWALYKCLEKFFSKESSIKFEIASTRWLPFKILNSFFIMEHGSSAFYKSKVPTGGSTREAYIQNLFLSRPEMLVGTNQRYFLTADMHTLAYNESNNFEFIRFSTMVRGNKYADHNNWKNRSRQNGLIVSKDGVKELLNFYF